MEEDAQRRRLRSFLLGGVVGASAALAAARRARPRPRRRRPAPAGLAAFEGAPCYREVVEREERDAASSRGSAAGRSRGGS